MPAFREDVTELKYKLELYRAYTLRAACIKRIYIGTIHIATVQMQIMYSDLTTLTYNELEHAQPNM